MRPLLIALLAAGTATAQLPSIRPLGPIVATSSEAFQAVPTLRALSDGHVVASDPVRRRVVVLDSALARPMVALAASNPPASAFPARGGTLFPWRGDTTLVLDAAGASFTILDGRGLVARVISVPRASDVSWLSSNGTLAVTSYGPPGIDSLGHLGYRTFVQPSGYNQRTFVMSWPDSAPVLSVSFDTRKADTMAYIKIPTPAPTVNTTDIDGTRRSILMSKPFELADDWAMLPDGTIAIIRWRDYHVDWVTQDHKRESSPKTAWNWVRMSDDDKSTLVDSLKTRNARADSVQNRFMAQMAPAGFKFAYETMTVAPSEVPDYPPPFIQRATRVDLDGRIWLLERGKYGQPSQGLVYDIIDRGGQIVDRVQAPPNAAVIGFGPAGAVYLSIAPSNAMLASSIPPVVPPQIGPATPPSPCRLAKAYLTRRP
jgi:hypothetical protein